MSDGGSKGEKGGEEEGGEGRGRGGRGGEEEGGEGKRREGSSGKQSMELMSCGPKWKMP